LFLTKSWLTIKIDKVKGGYTVDSNLNKRHGKTLTYQVGRKHGTIQGGSLMEEEDGHIESSWIASTGKSWLKTIWKPLPFVSSRALYVLFWLLPAVAFGMTWALAYLLVR
jgi:hypothetical protein